VAWVVVALESTIKKKKMKRKEKIKKKKTQGLLLTHTMST
jgi:hypothetical protein